MSAQEQGRTIEQQFAVLRAPVAVSGRPSALTPEQQADRAARQFNSGFSLTGYRIRHTREDAVITDFPLGGPSHVVEVPSISPTQRDGSVASLSLVRDTMSPVAVALAVKSYSAKAEH